MRISIFLLLWTTFSVSANVFSQNKLISLEMENSSMVEIIKAIRGASDYRFLYNVDELNKFDRRDFRVTEAPLPQIMKALLEGTNLTYEIENEVIMIRPGVSPQLVEKISLKGDVKDGDGHSLPGVTVLLKGTTTGVSSDINGHFSIQVPKSSRIVLVFSFVGMETKEVTYKGEKSIEVVLTPGVENLGEVIVTGYQTISRERSTGAYNIVKSDAVAQARALDLSTALLGTTAGMQGKENEDGSIAYTIRGMSSLYANAQPLVVVDGFPVSNGFQDINPNDVESVTVLKDAAAASIWGARSANGVVVVVTKKAKNRGKISIEANAMVKIGQKLDLSTILTTASSEDQVFFERMASKNGWISPIADMFTYINSPTSLAKEYLYDFANGKISEHEMNAGLDQLSRTNNRKQIKDLLLEIPITQQYNLSVSNASDRARNNLSLMYENTRGNMIRSNTDRWRINFTNQSSVFKWLDLNVGLNVHYVNAENSGLTVGEINSLSPYEMILNEDGSYARELTQNRDQLAKIPAGALPYDDWNYNILREARARKYTNETLNSRLQAGLVIKFWEGVTFDTKFMYELNKLDTDFLDKEDSYFVRNRVNTYLDYNQKTGVVNAQFIPKGGILRSSDFRVANYSWRNQLNIARTIANKHDINAIVGFETSQNESKSTAHPTVYGYDPEKNISAPLPFGGYSVNKGGQKVQIKNINGQNQESIPGIEMTMGFLRERFVSVYGNVGYSFDGKYSFSGSIRSDASNLITDKSSYRWAPLWSVGGSWNVHREPFMTPTASWLDMLSCRLTYGFNGNVEKSTSPSTLVSSSSVPSTSTGFLTTTVVNRGNPNLSWEKTSSLNIGVDFSLFSNMLFGNIDWYRKQGRDLIGEVLLPAALGATSQKMNSAELLNKGVEVMLGVNTQITNALNFSTRLTYAYNKSEITALHHPVYTAANILGNSYFVEGYPRDAIWAINYLGMKDGVAYVEGENGSQVSMNDNSMLYRGNGLDVLEYIGPAIDPHTLGWNGNFAAYGFKLSFLVTGKFGGHFRAPFFYSTISNEGKDIANKFIKEVIKGSDKVPSWQPADRAISSNWSSYTRYLNTLVESSSFIKLKEVSLEYNIPRVWINKWKVDNLKVYGQVRNLGCLWTANSYNYDPEWLPGSAKPSTTYTIGVTINL